jgi:hypothetical protein
MGLIGFFKDLFRRKHSKPTPIAPIEKEREFRKPQVAHIKAPPTVEGLPGVSVTIGLDFGTAATKCVINLEGTDSGKDRFLAISFPDGSTAEGSVCVPTSIGVQDDVLSFGCTAEEAGEENIIRSVKMAIPCMDAQWGRYRSPFMLHDKPGHFQLLDHTFSALDLSTLYLAVMIKQIKSQLSAYLKGKAEIEEVYLNIAAPLDHLVAYYENVEFATKKDRSEVLLGNIDRDTRVSAIYMKLSQWSLRLANKSQNPWDIASAVESLNSIKQEGVRPLEKSPAHVIPEAHAAISSYINRPRTREGRFISFDVGAGTTDISVFWLRKKYGLPKPLYYASGSLHSGMDDIDKCLSELIAPGPGASIRQSREAVEKDGQVLRVHHTHCEGIIKEIACHKSKVFGLAYDKERKLANWGDKNQANVTLLMLGGGSQSEFLKRVFQSVLWENVLGAPRRERLSLGHTDSIILPNGGELRLSETHSLSDHARLLVIAEGLAQKIIDIPDYDIQSEPLFVWPRIPRNEWRGDRWW